MCLSITQVVTDDIRVRQIVMNGLTNAIKYSNPRQNGPIRVAVSVQRGEPQGGAGPRAAGPRAAGADQRTLLAAPAPAAAAAAVTPVGASEWLVIDVLDRGPGLRGLQEKTLFTDFAAPTTEGTRTRVSVVPSSPSSPSPTGRSNPVGSSGVGLPICAR